MQTLCRKRQNMIDAINCLSIHEWRIGDRRYCILYTSSSLTSIFNNLRFYLMPTDNMGERARVLLWYEYICTTVQYLLPKMIKEWRIMKYTYIGCYTYIFTVFWIDKNPFWSEQSRQNLQTGQYVVCCGISTTIHIFFIPFSIQWVCAARYGHSFSYFHCVYFDDWA